MDRSLYVSYPDDLTLLSGDGGELTLQTPRCHVSYKQVPLDRSVIASLMSPGISVDDLIQALSDARTQYGIAQLFHWLQGLLKRGLLHVSAQDHDHRLATLIPTAPTFQWPSCEFHGHSRYCLSRFALLRREGDQAVIETPLAAARIVVHDPRVTSLILSLTTPKTCDELAEMSGDPQQVRRVMLLLIAAKIVDECGADDRLKEDLDPELQSWEFHDLLFHTRSRSGRHDYPIGATFRLADRSPALPALKPLSGQVIAPLPMPDVDELTQRDLTLHEAMETRRSIRHYGTQPLALSQLSEFLFRVARVKSQLNVELYTSTGLTQMEVTSRPYPSGGAIYPLEFYVIAAQCAGLSPGVYQYDPQGHQLVTVVDSLQPAADILTAAGLAAGMRSTDLQVLIVNTARFRRVSWKYSTLAYSLISKEVGIVMQNMYLVAAAMHLAPCALGVGDSDAFARLICSNYYAETSVGEFLLGSYPDRPELSEPLPETLRNKKRIWNSFDP